jgi:predicted dehydrogenase
MSQAIHTIDMLLHFAGDVESVCALAECVAHKNIEVEDIAVAILKFKNGAMGTIEGTTTAYSPTGHPAQVQLCGTDGSIFLADNTLTAWDFKVPRDEDRQIQERFGATAGAAGAGAADPKAIDYREHRRNFEDFVASIEEGREPSISGAESRRAIELILAIYESAMNGGARVHLPLKKSPKLRSLR